MAYRKSLMLQNLTEEPGSCVCVGWKVNEIQLNKCTIWAKRDCSARHMKSVKTRGCTLQVWLNNIQNKDKMNPQNI